MKLSVYIFAAVAAGKGEIPEAKASGDDEVNADACIYSEQNGITRVTTEPGITKLTKCYKRFQCNNGAKVQAKVNQMGLGTRQTECMKNFVKLEYSIPRDDFQDFYHWTDHFCDEDLERGWELGKWMNMEDDVLFSFEFNEPEYYEWFYSYSQYMYDYYAGQDPHPYPHYPAEEIAKFEIQFKCSNIPDDSDEPDTTTLIPPTNPPGPTTTTINQNYNTIDQEFV